jgi:hypothetical protein
MNAPCWSRDLYYGIFSKRVANFVYKLMFETKVKPLFLYLSPCPPLHKCGEGESKGVRSFKIVSLSTA